MIDKITPRPADAITRELTAEGFEQMEPVQTAKHTYIAPFVNAEVPQYLVVEDCFPNGRPALEKAGVYMTDRDTVNRTERMKVTTCLNPLHTALAVFGCLLGYTLIADEMKDPDLKRLVERIGYTEGLPVVTDPKILSPENFLREVLEQRLPNPFMPDTPQRIACDTSQKVPIRFGETIKSRLADGSAEMLEGIPLAIAAWLRYLLAVDDRGEAMAVSPDPMLGDLQQALSSVRFGEPDSVKNALDPILANPVIFATDLTQTPLARKIRENFSGMLIPGGVRAALKKI
jgi:fructuronate reductase